MNVAACNIENHALRSSRTAHSVWSRKADNSGRPCRSLRNLGTLQTAFDTSHPTLLVFGEQGLMKLGKQRDSTEQRFIALDRRVKARTLSRESYPVSPQETAALLEVRPLRCKTACGCWNKEQRLKSISGYKAEQDSLLSIVLALRYGKVC